MWTNWSREKRYMLFSFCMSPILMNRLAPWCASGRYTSRYKSKSCWRLLELSRLTVISIDLCLVSLRLLMSSLFSRMFPFELASKSKRFFSRSAMRSFRSSSYCRHSDFRYSISGFSWLIIIDSNLASSPLLVTVKLTTWTMPSSPGVNWISLFLVTIYILKSSL